METARELSEVFQETAVVEALAGERIVVRSASGRFEARKAASCALVPTPGDRVLLAVPRAGEIYVLAVLVRAERAEPERWAFGPEAELRSPGSLHIVGGEGVEIRSPSRIEMMARAVAVSAVEGTLGIERLHVAAGVVDASARAVKTVLGTLDQVLERASMHVKRSYRFVEELDLTRAEHIEQRATQTLSMRGKNAFVAAEDLVKVDGDQIHLG